MNQINQSQPEAEDSGFSFPAWLAPLRGAFYVAAYVWLCYETVVLLRWWAIPVVVLLVGLSVASAASGCSEWVKRRRIESKTSVVA